MPSPAPHSVSGPKNRGGLHLRRSRIILRLDRLQLKIYSGRGSAGDDARYEQLRRELDEVEHEIGEPTAHQAA